MPPKKQALPLLQAWSYSVYTSWLECPRRTYFRSVAKIRMPEDKGPPLIKGDMVHKAAETYVSTVTRTPKLEPDIAGATAQLQTLNLPKLDLAREVANLRTAAANLAKHKPELEAIRKARGRTEVEWAFTRQYTPTGWFAKDAWLRIKVDVYTEEYKPQPLLAIIDYKTGKTYPEHRQQRSLYALGGLQLVALGALMSKADAANVTATAAHWYTDTGFKDTETFGMASLKPLVREWAARTKEMLNDTVYPARPSARACRFCPYKKSLGGPCLEDM